MDVLDKYTLLNWLNGTLSYAVDRLVRSLRVATRVRIPLGLQKWA